MPGISAIRRRMPKPVKNAPTRAPVDVPFTQWRPTMFSALNVLAPLGYVTTGYIVGRHWVKGTSTGARVGAFFTGFGILRLIALIPGIGFLVWIVVCVYGLGAVSMAGWYGGHRVRDDEPPPDAPPPTQPPPMEPPTEPPTPEPDPVDAPIG